MKFEKAMSETELFRHVTCTRRLLPSNTAEAMKRGVFLHQHAFTSIRTLGSEHLKDPERLHDHTLVFTSLHAVLAIRDSYGLTAKRPLSSQCYCIKGRTAKAARDTGFDVIGSAPNATELAKLIIRDGGDQLLHCSGNRTRKELYERLSANGIGLDKFECYSVRTHPRSMPEHEAIMFFSPSQVDAFLTMNKLKNTTLVFCIGKTTGSHCKEIGYKNVTVAEEANESAMMQILFDHLQEA